MQKENGYTIVDARVVTDTIFSPIISEGIIIEESLFAQKSGEKLECIFRYTHNNKLIDDMDVFVPIYKKEIFDTLDSFQMDQLRNLTDDSIVDLYEQTLFEKEEKKSFVIKMSKNGRYYNLIFPEDENK